MATTQYGSEIQEFYRDTNVFITGGTGFVGKLITEKLLRSCPGIKKIYFLCRQKKGKEINNRIAEQFLDPLYDLAKEIDPEFKSKIVPILGDCAQINLGIGKEDKEMLVNEINIILHCAATVRFDEPLRLAVRINVRSTRDLFLLARGMKRLKALVHVSTAYSNCVRHHIEEKLYEPPFDCNELMRLVETADEDTLSRITPGLLGEYPNTYTYTKVIGEDIVKQNSEGLPVCILRPSIITATFKEPYAGWCDNIYGAMGLVISTFLGILHTYHGDPNKIAALVPGDYVANVTIVAAWGVAQNWDKRQLNGTISSNRLGSTNEIPIYNYSGSAERALTWGDFMKILMKYIHTLPTLNCIWVPFVIMTKYKYVDLTNRCLLHYLPAYIFDGLLFSIGKQPSYVKIYKRMHKMMEFMSSFSRKEWQFENENTQNLYAKLNATDKELFDFNMNVMNWSEYLKRSVTGIRVYMLKDPLTTLPQARRKLMMLRVVKNILLIILVFALYYMWIMFKNVF